MRANLRKRPNSVPGATNCGDGFLVRINGPLASSMPNGILELFLSYLETCWQNLTWLWAFTSSLMVIGANGGKRGFGSCTMRSSLYG